MEIKLSDITLGIISGVGVYKDHNNWKTHFSFGRILSAMAPSLKKTIYCAKQYPSAQSSMDHILEPDHIEVRPGPFFSHTSDALKKPGPLKNSYKQIINDSDVVFIRGNMPFAYCIHKYCARVNKPVMHWMVGNPIKLMLMSARYGGLKDQFGKYYTRLDDWLVRRAMRKSHPAVIVNGCELGELWGEFDPEVVVSTTLQEGDYRKKEDTCQNDTIRILFVGFIRPEKGLEYLFEALPRIETKRKIELVIVGPRKGYAPQLEKIHRIIDDNNLKDHVQWAGYKSGNDLLDELDNADIFVLPTLSEGTPRVLVEARARCLPVVSTTVGGIPSSVESRKDGILVPPKDPDALAKAIGSIINDDDFRRTLINNGYKRARELTVDWFAGRFLAGIERAWNNRYSNL